MAREDRYRCSRRHLARYEGAKESVSIVKRPGDDRGDPVPVRPRLSCTIHSSHARWTRLGSVHAEFLRFGRATLVAVTSCPNRSRERMRCSSARAPEMSLRDPISVESEEGRTGEWKVLEERSWLTCHTLSARCLCHRFERFRSTKHGKTHHKPAVPRLCPMRSPSWVSVI